MTFVGAFEMRPAGDIDGDARRLVDKWWVVALLGLALTVIGLILLLDLTTAATTLALLVAFGLFAEGVDEVFEAGRHRVRWPGYLLGGLWIATGVIAVAWPDITLWALAFVVGVSFLIGGGIQVGAALAMHRVLPMWGIWFVVGALSALLGVLCIAWPEATILVLAVLLGLRILMRGILTLAFAFALRSVRSGLV
jgi:uncharacterized membrane protein HdeD (DUF308 family)